MLKGEELKGLRNKLLRSAAGFYRKLEGLLQGQSDRASRAILAQSYFELGDLTEKIGIKPEALAVHRKALAIRRELASAADADSSAKLDLARSLNATGGLAQATGDNAGALSALEEARSLAGPLADGPGATDAARDVLSYQSRSDRFCTVYDRPSGRGDEVAPKAVAIRQKLADDNPAVTEFRSNLATATTTSAWCSRRPAIRPRRWSRSVAPWRSSRSWPTTTPPSPISATAWRAATTTSA